VRGEGLTVLRAGSAEGARALAAGDPFVVAGLRDYTVARWTLIEGALHVALRLSDSSFTVEGTDMPDTMTVGIIGVGTMGLPVAGNLVDAGHPVVGYHRRAMPAEFLALGGTALASPAEVAQRAMVVLTILPGPEACERWCTAPTALSPVPASASPSSR